MLIFDLLISFCDGTTFHACLLRYPIGMSAALRGVYHGKWCMLHRILGEMGE